MDTEVTLYKVSPRLHLKLLSTMDAEMICKNSFPVENLTTVLWFPSAMDTKMCSQSFLISEPLTTYSLVPL